MFPLMNDLNRVVSYTKEQLQVTTFHEIIFAQVEKEYDIRKLNSLYLIQEITGLLFKEDFNENEMLIEAQKIMEEVLYKLQHDEKATLQDCVDGLKKEMTEDEMENFLVAAGYNIKDEEGCIDSVSVSDLAVDFLNFKSSITESGELHFTAA